MELASAPRQGCHVNDELPLQNLSEESPRASWHLLLHNKEHVNNLIQELHLWNLLGLPHSLLCGYLKSRPWHLLLSNNGHDNELQLRNLNGFLHCLDHWHLWNLRGLPHRLPCGYLSHSQDRHCRCWKDRWRRCSCGNWSSVVVVTGAAQTTVRAGVTNFTTGAGCTCSTTKTKDSKTDANDEHGWRIFCNTLSLYCNCGIETSGP